MSSWSRCPAEPKNALDDMYRTCGDERTHHMTTATSPGFRHLERHLSEEDRDARALERERRPQRQHGQAEARYVVAGRVALRVVAPVGSSR